MLFSSFASRALALGLLIGLASAAPASAIPVSVYADGSTDFGFDPNDVAAAIAAGADEPTPVGTMDDGVPWLTITTPDRISGLRGKDRLNPSRGSSIWTLHIGANAPQDQLQNFALVILGHDPNDPVGKYKSENVGLEIDTALPWLFVTSGGSISTTGTAGSDPVYVAFLLGDLEAGENYHMPIEYRLGQKLKKGKNAAGEKVFMFPRYSYAIVSVSGVPEPSTLALLLLGAGTVAFAARRAR
jgi:hypothetical protein